MNINFNLDNMTLINCLTLCNVYRLSMFICYLSMHACLPSLNMTSLTKYESYCQLLKVYSVNLRTEPIVCEAESLLTPLQQIPCFVELTCAACFNSRETKLGTFFGQV